MIVPFRHLMICLLLMENMISTGGFITNVLKELGKIVCFLYKFLMAKIHQTN